MVVGAEVPAILHLDSPGADVLRMQSRHLCCEQQLIVQCKSVVELRKLHDTVANARRRMNGVRLRLYEDKPGLRLFVQRLG